ncbi:MAG: carboxypeptidase regulatory-like domain-containing protein [Hyphomicrobiaceae bacterium]|nr:carboxypeptidase regulatory-like domain-containing protein [Hyphomicrobiaceae bacterium]
MDGRDKPGHDNRGALAAVVILAALALSACQSTEPKTVKIDSAFDPKAAAIIKAQGTTRIDGHAFIKKPSGTPAFAVGEIVRLVPATPYAKERFDKLFGGKKFVAATAYPKAEDTDPRYAEFTRTTKSESSGRFSFENVAPGTYYVTTQIVWQPEENKPHRGGAVYEIVTVTGREDKPIKVILNGV